MKKPITAKQAVADQCNRLHRNCIPKYSMPSTKSLELKKFLAVLNSLIIDIGPVWINNLFAAYSTSGYYDKRLCISLHKRFL